MKKRVRILWISILITLSVGIGVAIVQNIANDMNLLGDNARNIRNISAKELQKGEMYCAELDGSYEKVWETSTNIIPRARVERQVMYLIPLKSEINTYIGIMTKENLYSGEFQGTYVGKLKSFDWLMDKKINENLEKMGMESENITVIPMYIDSANNLISGELLGLLILEICVLIFLSCFIIRKGEKEKPHNERILFRKDEQGNVKWCRGLEGDIPEKSTGYQMLNNIVLGTEVERIGIQLKKHFRSQFLTFFIGLTIFSYILYGVVFSFDPSQWYYGFYGQYAVITLILILVEILVNGYWLRTWIVNPLGKKADECAELRRREGKYQEMSFDEKGRLFKKGKGCLFLSDEYFIVGNTAKMKALLYQEVKKISYCFIQMEMNQREFGWLRIYDFSGEYYDVYLSEEVLRAAMVSFKKAWENKQQL